MNLLNLPGTLARLGGARGKASALHRVRGGVVLSMLLLVSALSVPVILHGQGSQPQRLMIATRHVPPFAIRSEDGVWNGISIDLWRELADDLSLAYEFHEADLEGMIAGLQDGTYDAAVAALTMTAEREQVIDFTHPFYNSGLGIAVPVNGSAGWASVLRRVASTGFAKVVAALALLLFLVGFLVWFFERKRNPEQFGGKTANGIGAGVWWSAVTMTTVGYGDKTPCTVGGRTVALIWMFASILLISSFTAAIASVLTVSQLDTGLDGPEDLPGLRVGALRNSTSETYLRRNHIMSLAHDTPQAALDALAAGELNAVVYDAPILGYLVNKELRLPLRLLPRVFARQSYAIALPPNSTLREDINRVLLKQTAEPWWQDTLYRYLGI